MRARDLFYALWIPDLFMRRVEKDGMWSLMCPHQCPGLSDCWGEEFEKLYEKYVDAFLSLFSFQSDYKPRSFTSWWHAWNFNHLSFFRYEAEGRYMKQVKAQQVWMAVIESQVETGTPFMLYKDACNGKSNQQNIGTIKSSNLCTEIVEYSAPDEIAVCNLASVAVNMFVKPDKTYDFEKLREVTKIVTKNLNKIIDVNYYPVPEVIILSSSFYP